MPEADRRAPSGPYRPRRTKPQPSRRARIGGLRAEAGRAVEVFGLIGFAVVNPVLGPFGESPASFVATGASSGDIVRFALTIVVVPFVILASVGAASRLLGRRARAVTHLVAVGLLAGTTAGIVARHLGAGAGGRWAALVVGGAAAGFARWRWKPVQYLLRYTAIAPVLFVVLFLFSSPVAPLVQGSDDPAPGANGALTSDDEASPHVMVIVIDEVGMLSLLDGEGNIDANLFPNVARLADTGTLYRNHTTVAPSTRLALPAIVTGRVPRSITEPAPVTANYPDTLFTLLADSHRLHSREFITEFCPRSMCPPPPAELDEDALSLLHQADLPDSRPALSQLLDEARSIWWNKAWPPADTPESEYVEVGFDDPHELVRPGLEFLTGLTEDPDDPRPVFDYVHLPVPHGPWQLVPSGRNYDAPYPPVGGEFMGWADTDLGQDLALAGRNRHLLQMQWTDRLLGSIFDRLVELGRWDDTMVVLTADHGVAFGRGAASRMPNPDNQIEVGWVPLIIKQPGQAEAEVSEANTWSVDLVPTVAAVTGRDLTWESDGRSLTDPPRTETVKPIVTPTADEFDTVLTDRFGSDVAHLDAEGLVATRLGFAAYVGLEPALLTTTPGDDLAGWRHGRHGHLVGRAVDDIGVCSSPSPARLSRYQAPTGWEEWWAGTLDPESPLPVWHEAQLSGVDQIDVALVVEGSVAGWAPSRPGDGVVDVGAMVAQPVIESLLADHPTGTAAAPPALFEITSDQDCGLAPISAG